jgi:hypothetical protein
MGGGRFLSLFVQTAPNLLIAQVIDVANLGTPSQTATVTRQQTITGAIPTSMVFGNNATTSGTTIRMWRLSANRVLVAYRSSTSNTASNFRFNVLEIEGGTNRVITKLDAAGEILTNLSGFSNVLGVVGAGDLGAGAQLTENVVAIANYSGTTSTGTLLIRRFTYNSVANTLSVANAWTLSLTVASLIDDFFSFSAIRVPGSATAVAFVLRRDSQTTPTFSSAQVNAVIIVDVETVEALTIPASPGRLFIPFAGGTSGLFLTNSAAGRYWSSSTGLGASVQFAPTSTSSVPTDAVVFDQNYIGFVTNSGTTAETAGGSAFTFRVLRFTDPNLIETSVGTTAGTGGSLGAASSWFIDQPILTVVNSNVLLAVATASATAFRIRTLFVS